MKDATERDGLLFRVESFAVQGAIFEVYRQMGSGFLEAVYQECLEHELQSRGVPFRSQVGLELHYRGEKLVQQYRADLICYESIVVELKAARTIEQVHRAQVLNYLKATGLRLGLLVNFGAYPKAIVERLVLGEDGHARISD